MPPTKPLLLVIAGPNGSGKTEITRIIGEKHRWTDGLIKINPDDIAQQQFGDWNNPTAIKKAADLADEMREKCLSNRQGLFF